LQYFQSNIISEKGEEKMRLIRRVLTVFIGIALLSCLFTPVMGDSSPTVDSSAEGWAWMHQLPEQTIWDWMNPQSEPIWDWMHPQSQPTWAWLNPQPEPPIWDWMKSST
jgi:hypothetical protein